MVDYSELTDERLQAMALEGDAAAETQLAIRYSRLVKICARPYFLAGGDSEDLTQEGMLGLLSAIRGYNAGMDTAFRTYAELCIRRRLISAIKSASRLKHTPLNEGVSFDEVLSEETTSLAVCSGDAFRRSPEEQVLARERADEIIHIYPKVLSRLEMTVYTLFLEGLSYGEIAARAGKSVKQVDNAVQRIRRKLAQDPDSGEISES